MNNILYYKYIVLIVCFVSYVLAIEVDISLGEAFSINQRLSIINSQDDIIEFDAIFKTNGLKIPYYYSIRFIKELKTINVEIEHIHHKLYVEQNLPNRVSKFEVTDGYNLFLINLSDNITDYFSYRVGIGTVVSHPDIIVDGQTNYIRGGGAIPKVWFDGYHWSGISTQISGFYKSSISDKWSYQIEAKLIYANTVVPIEEGEVELPNTSIHILFGLSRKLKGYLEKNH